MPITDLLERNSKLYGDEVALVEINPEVREEQRVSWQEYELIQPTGDAPYRREITWSIFDEKANRVANMLLGRGIRKGQKVAVLMMNCLEWLPIYFGILKTGAIAVPLNFRYTSDEIDYCLRLADADVLFFGPEFTSRMEPIVPKINRQMLLFFVGEHCPPFAEDYLRATANCSSRAPKVLVDDEDEAAIYYSSGTTGFPKAILLKHAALMQRIHKQIRKIPDPVRNLPAVKQQKDPGRTENPQQKTEAVLSGRQASAPEQINGGHTHKDDRHIRHTQNGNAQTDPRRNLPGPEAPCALPVQKQQQSEQDISFHDDSGFPQR